MSDPLLIVSLMTLGLSILLALYVRSTLELIRVENARSEAVCKELLKLADEIAAGYFE